MKQIKMFIAVFASVSILLLNVAYSAEYKTASPFVRVTTNMLGYNFLVKKIAQSVIRHSLNKAAKGKYSVKFDSFSGVDLKKGKFRGLTIEGKNISSQDNFSVSRLYLKTVSDFNYVDYRKNPVVFMTDLPMNYEIELTEEDLNNSFAYGDMFVALSALIPLVKIEKPIIKIVNQKIRIQSSLKFPFAKTIKFSMSAGLKIENGKMVLSNVESSGSRDFANKIKNLINNQNVLENISLRILDGADTKIAVNNVNIRDNKVYIDGLLTIEKSK